MTRVDEPHVRGTLLDQVETVLTGIAGDPRADVRHARMGEVVRPVT